MAESPRFDVKSDFVKLNLIQSRGGVRVDRIMFEISVISTPGLASLPKLLTELGFQSERDVFHSIQYAFYYNGRYQRD